MQTSVTQALGSTPAPSFIKTSRLTPSICDTSSVTGKLPLAFWVSVSCKALDFDEDLVCFGFEESANVDERDLTPSY